MADVTELQGGKVNITPDSLNKSYIKYRKELITIPTRSLSLMLPYVTIRPGVRYKEVIGQLDGDAQLRPYNKFAIDRNDVDIAGRELQTYLGSVVKQFDPNSVIESIYGSDTVQGDGLKGVPVTALVFAYLLKKIGENLFNVVFTAERDDNGDKTKDLFNGFRTIAKMEIADGKISEDKGNLHYFSKITPENAIDVFEEFVLSSNSKLLEQQNLNLLCSPTAEVYYKMAYRERFGSLKYNDKFDKQTLDIAKNVNIVALPNVPDDFLQLSTKKNVQIGLCTNAPECNFQVNKSLVSHFLLDFVGTMFFGTQYESISPEFLHIGMLKESSSPNTPSQGGTEQGGQEGAGNTQASEGGTNGSGE